MILRSDLTSANMSALKGAALCRPKDNVMSSFFMSMVASFFKVVYRQLEAALDDLPELLRGVVIREQPRVDCPATRSAETTSVNKVAWYALPDKP